MTNLFVRHFSYSEVFFCSLNCVILGTTTSDIAGAVVAMNLLMCASVIDRLAGCFLSGLLGMYGGTGGVMICCWLLVIIGHSLLFMNQSKLLSIGITTREHR